MLGENQINLDNAQYHLNNKSLLIIESNQQFLVANAGIEVRNLFFIDIPKRKLGSDIQLFKE